MIPVYHLFWKFITPSRWFLQGLSHACARFYVTLSLREYRSRDSDKMIVLIRRRVLPAAWNLQHGLSYLDVSAFEIVSVLRSNLGLIFKERHGFRFFTSFSQFTAVYSLAAHE
jgi:hypothetical protein